LSPAAKRKFRETVKHLEIMNVLTVVDGDAIAIYADLWTWLWECRSFLNTHGDCFPTFDSDGNLTGYRQYCTF
jgi:phage terminase small subunit